MATNNTTDCWDVFLQPKFEVLLGLRTTLSFLSSLFIVSMIAIMIFFQRYKFFTQRLSLYLATSALSFAIATCLDVSANSSYTNIDALRYCQFIGFVEIVTIWWFNIATAISMLVVFVEVVLKRSTDRLELLFVLVIFGFPLSFTWIPFITSHYGPVGYFCWITTINIEEDCQSDTIGTILNLILYYVPTYFIMVVISCLLLMAFVSVRRERKGVKLGHQRTDESKIQKKLESELRPLMLYPLIVLVTNVFGIMTLIGTLINAESVAVYVLHILSTIAFRLQGILITLAYTLQTDTRNKLKRSEVKKQLQHCSMCFDRKKESEAVEYQMGRVGRTDSRKENIITDNSTV